MKVLQDWQATVGLTRGIEARRLDALKVGLGNGDAGNGPGVVGVIGIAAIGEVGAAEGDIVAVHTDGRVSTRTRVDAEHVEVRIVAVARVVVKERGDRVVVGVEARRAVLEREAKARRVLGRGRRDLRHIRTVTAGFEAISVAYRGHRAGLVTVEPRPGVLDGARGVCVDEVVAVVGVPPSAVAGE